jgi:hypothetical protein
VLYQAGQAIPQAYYRLQLMIASSTSFIRPNWRALANVIGNTFNIYEKFTTGRTMEALIEEIVRKLHHLPEGKILYQLGIRVTHFTPPAPLMKGGERENKCQSQTQLVLEVLDFVEFLTWNKEHSISQQVDSDVTSQEDQEFEVSADQVADEFEIFIGSSIPVLSDYAVSRAGIYEEHPSR